MIPMPAADFPNFLAEALYARGFLLTEEEVPAPVAHWRRERIGGLCLWHDPRSPFRRVACADRWVAVLGSFVDVRAPERHVEQILCSMVDLDRDSLLAATDHWSGRYALFCGDAKSTAVATDAVATRTVFYSVRPPFVAGSHAALVAETANAEPWPEMAAYLDRQVMYGLPGDATAWRGVRILTPNQSLDPATLALTRFWPRNAPPERTVAEAGALAAGLMRSTVEGLMRRPAPIIASLTAGLDSRATLAACREHFPRIRFFTYSSGDYHRADMEFAASAARRLGLRHGPVETALKIEAPLLEIMRRNAPRRHFRRAARAFARVFPRDTLHLRSSTAEIGRCFYRDPAKCFPLNRAEDLARAWCTNPREAKSDAAAFGDWAERVSFWDAQGIERFGLFNWEHRMGAWHSSILLETDIALDTHVMYNCRALFEALLSAPKAEREAGKVFHEAIRRNWPDLLGMPINGVLAA